MYAEKSRFTQIASKHSQPCFSEKLKAGITTCLLVFLTAALAAFSLQALGATKTERIFFGVGEFYSNEGDIWSMNPDGSDRRPFIEGDGIQTDLAMSSDGRYAKFHDNRFPRGQETRLRDLQTGEEWGAGFFPYGFWISSLNSFVTSSPNDVEPCGIDLVLFSPGGGVERLLDRNSNLVAVAAGSSSPFVFFTETPCGQDGNVMAGDLMRLDTRNGAISKIIESDGKAFGAGDLSNDGTKLVLQRESGDYNDVVLMDINGGSQRTIASNAFDIPKFSPDGKKIAVYRFLPPLFFYEIYDSTSGTSLRTLEIDSFDTWINEWGFLLEPDQSDDHGDTCEAATTIEKSGTTSGTLNPATDEDFFRIQLDKPGVLTVETTGTTATQGSLLDSGCNEIAEDDNAGSNNNFRISRELNTGTYHVRVNSDGKASTGNYQIQTSFVESEPIELDDIAGMAGPWYDPSTDGDGFNVVIVDRPGQSPLLVVYFYGYDAYGKRMWLVSDAITPQSESAIQGITMSYPSGTGFQGAGDHSLTPYAELDIEILGCGSARFTLRNGNTVIRTWNASQIADIPGPGCLLGEGPRNYQTISGLSGAWFKSDEPGDGLNLIMTDYGLAAYFYGYDKDGNPLWLIASNLYDGPIIPGKDITLNLVQGTGGWLTDVRYATLESWGTMTLMFKDCTSAEVSMNGLDGTKSVSMIQLAQIGKTSCEAPGAISLSESTLTFEGVGQPRQVIYAVTDGDGSPVSSTHVEYSILDGGVLSATSFNNGTATFEAITNNVTSTQVRFWDPVYNAVEDMPITVVDLQPGVKFISEANVITWPVPTMNQNREIRLNAHSETNGIRAGDFIASEMGRVARVISVSTAAGEIRVNGGFARLTEVYSNLKYTADEQLSSARYSNRVDQDSGIQSVKSKRRYEKRKFEIAKVENLPEALNCEAQSSSIFDQFDLGPRFELWMADTEFEVDLNIQWGVFIKGISEMSFSTRLLGRVEAGFAANAQQGVSVHCTIGDFDMQTPIAFTPFGAFVGVIPVEVGLDFSLLQQFPDPISLDVGTLVTAGMDFERDDYYGGMAGGLSGDRWVNFSGFTINNVAVDTELNVEPYIKASLGIEYWPEIATLTFAEAYLGVPYNFTWRYPDAVNSLDYLGPSQRWALTASAKLQAKIDSFIFDLFDIDPIPLTPGLNLFNPIDYTLYETPRISLTEMSCGANCDVGDTRTFRMDIEQDGLIGGKVYGSAYLLTSKTGFNRMASKTISGTTPHSRSMTVTPSEEGTLYIMPRFESSAFKTTYGGPSLAIDVGGSTVNYTLSVGISGSGSVSSSPAGISCPSDCTQDYATGQSVALTATESSGWEFERWTGACNHTGRTCDVSMTSDKSASAVFKEVTVAQYNLSVSISGSGSVSSSPAGISCPNDCSQNYNSGQSVALTATASSGWEFERWSGTCNHTSRTCNVSMTTTRSVTAIFKSQTSVPQATAQWFTTSSVLDDVIGGYSLTQNSNVNTVYSQFVNGVYVARFDGSGSNNGNTNKRTPPNGNRPYLYRSGTLLGSTDGTVSFWLKVAEENSSGYGLFYERGDWYGHLQVARWPDNQMTVKYGIDDVNTAQATVTGLDSWTHISAVHSSNTISLYVNGNLVATGSAGEPGSAYATVIGGTRDGKTYLIGDLHDYRLWVGTVLTGQQIKAVYNEKSALLR